METEVFDFEPQVVNIKAKDGWQPGRLNIADGEQVLITANGTWETHPPNPCGPSGFDGRLAGPNYVVEGLPEGCLLVKDSRGNIYNFPRNNSTVVIQVPGDVMYIANDDIKGRGDYGTKGFSDNKGSLQVTQIKKKL
jgi:hypothetical protein